MKRNHNKGWIGRCSDATDGWPPKTVSRQPSDSVVRKSDRLPEMHMCMPVAPDQRMQERLANICTPDTFQRMEVGSNMYTRKRVIDSLDVWRRRPMRGICAI